MNPRTWLRLVLAAVLAFLPAAGAGATSAGFAPEYQRLFEGPLPGRDGGAWFAVAEGDGSLVVARLGDNGSLLDEVTLQAEGLELDPELVVDDDGRFWVPGRSVDESWDIDEVLVVFDADGRFLAADEQRGAWLVGVESRVARLLAEPAGDGPPELWHQDPLSGHSVVAFALRESWNLVTAEALADDGATWILSSTPGEGPGGSESAVLRRYSPTGVELNAWRLLGVDGHAGLHPSRDGAVVLSDSGDDGTALWTIDGTGVTAGWRVADTPWIERLVPVAGGGLLVRAGEELLRLDADGREVGHLAVTAVPSWENRSTATAAGAADPIGAVARTAGSEAERAVERWRDLGAEGVDRLVEWHTRGPRAKAAEADAPGALFDHLFEELVEADPEAVGARATALLPQLDADVRRRLADALVKGWPRPSAGFVALMAEALTSDDDVRWPARSAFASRDPEGRFPVSPPVYQLFLAELVAAHAKQNRSPDSDFFLYRFAEVAADLDRVLANPAHPARPAVVAWLQGLPERIPSPYQLTAGGEQERSLAAWALRWSASSDPGLATAARLVAAAAGDEASLAALPAHREATVRQDDFLARLRQRHPERFADALVAALAEPALTGPVPPPFRTRVLHVLYAAAPPAQRAALFARLADPALPADAVRAVASVFTVRQQIPGEPDPDAALDPEVVARVAASSVLRPHLTANAPLVAFLWQRLDGRPGLRRELEPVFRDACAEELDDHRQRVETTSGRPSPSRCIELAAASGVGRLVPDRWLLDHLAHYQRPDRSSHDDRWLPLMVEMERRRGPLPGLAERILREVAAADRPAVGIEELTAVLGAEGLPAAWAEAAALPLLDLGAAP